MTIRSIQKKDLNEICALAMTVGGTVLEALTVRIVSRMRAMCLQHTSHNGVRPEALRGSVL